MGWAIPLPGMLWWLTQEMCDHRGRMEDYWQMSFITIRRSLWSISYTFKDLAVWILLAYNVWRHEAIYQKMWAMSKAQKHKYKGCNATHQQPSNWALSCLGNRLYGSISSIKELWVRLGGNWLCLQVGGGTTLQTRWQHQFKEDVWRNYVSKIWSPQSSDNWWRSTLHWQMLRALSIKTWNPSQHRYPLSSLDKWPSRDFQQEKSRIFFRRQSMKWERHGRTSYLMHSRHTE